MGDRANVYVTQHGHGVYLYTHWHGYNLPRTVQDALNRHARWSDASYLTRIIFEEMVGKDVGKETGYGISPVAALDREHPIICVDCDRHTIGFLQTKDVKDEDGFPIEYAPKWSFGDYCELETKDLIDLWEKIPR